jgi:hypothetical protein
MMTPRYLTKHVTTEVAPMVWNQVRKHHFLVKFNNGIPDIKYLRPHTQLEANKMGTTMSFLNRHFAEIHDFNGAALSDNVMDRIATVMRVFRQKGFALKSPENPPTNTTIAGKPNLSSFPHSNGVVDTNHPDVLGIASKAKGPSPATINTSAVVKQNNQGIINHLESSS